MKVLLRGSKWKLVSRWIERGLFAGAVLMLGFCGFVLLDMQMFQQHETQKFESLLEQVNPMALPVGPVASVGPDGLIGRMEIARLNVSVIVAEGTSRRTLRRAAGHIEGTALPGETGNVGISAHRDTFFRPLRNVQTDDIITLATLRGEYRYRVVSTQVVKPDNVAVLNSDGHEVLTLVTCYPFYFIGPAPSRFIVRAERIT